MLAKSNIKPLNICNFGLSDQTSCLLKKKNIIGKVNKTVKKYLAHVICKIGRSALKYLARPSITGKNIHPNKLKIMAFISQLIQFIRSTLKQRIQQLELLQMTLQLKQQLY